MSAVARFCAPVAGVLVTAAGLVGLASAAGLAGATSAGVASASDPVAPVPGTPATSPALATAEHAYAEKVLAEAPIPAGSTLVARAPSALDQPPDRPVIALLVDLHRFYETRDSQAAFAAAVRRLLPAGARWAGTSSGTSSGNQGSVSSVAYSLPTPGPNEYFAQVVYSFAPSGSASAPIGSASAPSSSVSIVRVDAQAAWAPDRPAADAIPVVTGGDLTGYATVSLAGSSTTAPPIALDRSDAAKLAAALNALPESPGSSCMESAPEYSIALRAASGTWYQVTTDECGALVVVKRAGHTLSELTDDRCAVLRLVGRLVPASAKSTRQMAAACRPADA